MGRRLSRRVGVDARFFRGRAQRGPSLVHDGGHDIDLLAGVGVFLGRCHLWSYRRSVRPGQSQCAQGGLNLCARAIGLWHRAGSHRLTSGEEALHLIWHWAFGRRCCRYVVRVLWPVTVHGVAGSTLPGQPKNRSLFAKRSRQKIRWINERARIWRNAAMMAALLEWLFVFPALAIHRCHPATQCKNATPRGGVVV